MSAVTGRIIKSEDDQGMYLQELERECLLRENNISISEGTWCPIAWDGILCWPVTEAGVVATQQCPDYIAGFHTHGVATRQCLSEGVWFWNKESNATWTNFSQCYSDTLTNIVIPFLRLDNSSLIAQYVPVVKTVSHIGYGVSLATLLISLCVLATFKKLRCPRNKLHMHLFVSFMLRGFTTLLKDSLFVQGIGLPSDLAVTDSGAFLLKDNQYNWKCKLITSLWQYFIMANYSWILMEGLYLHNIIFFAVFSDISSIGVYVILGWGLPVLFVVPWIIVRALFEDTLCWTTNDNPLYFLLIKAPTTVSILVNLILFLNIVRVVLLKLRAAICEETRRFRYRRWAKSTLVLVPLFGVHYVVFMTITYIGVDGTVELIWLFIDQLFASFQGFFVAVLYCLLNGEVRSEIAKKWHYRPKCRLQNTRKHPSIPFGTPPQKNEAGKIAGSYLGAVFNKRRKMLDNKGKRGSTIDSYVNTVISSVPMDFTSTSKVSPVCKPALYNPEDISYSPRIGFEGVNDICEDVEMALK